MYSALHKLLFVREYNFLFNIPITMMHAIVCDMFTYYYIMNKYKQRTFILILKSI